MISLDNYFDTHYKNGEKTEVARQGHVEEGRLM
jgi:hypothetical protein